MRSTKLLLRVVIVGALLFLNLNGAANEITVYKTTTCGCCGSWVDHLKSSGFQVTVKNVSSTAEYQEKFGVPEKLQSCHTAVVDGYTIEGHVPASEIQRLLKERPKAKGLAVPGMPIGAPGMEADGRSDRYAVLLFQADGTTSVYREYSAR